MEHFRNTHHFSRPTTIRDHFLTQEAFSVSWNETNDIGQTKGVNTSKLDKYYRSTNYLSHQKEKSGLMGMVYRLAQNYTLSFKLRTLKPLLSQNASVLDYGCGLGDFVSYLNRKGYSAQGYEPSLDAVEIAQKKRLPVSASSPFPQSNAAFDMITLWHVLEHIPDTDYILSMCHRALKEDGILVLALPNPNAKDAQTYGAQWAAWDVPRHLWHFTPAGIIKKMHHLDFTHESTYPLKLDAYYVSLLSEGYKNSRFRWLKGFWNGLISNLEAQKTGNYSSLIYVFRKR